jgi:histone H3/H4
LPVSRYGAAASGDSGASWSLLQVARDVLTSVRVNVRKLIPQLWEAHPTATSVGAAATSELGGGDGGGELGLLRLPIEVLIGLDTRLRATAGGPYAACQLRAASKALRCRLPPLGGVAAERIYLAELGTKLADEEASWVEKHEKAKWDHHRKAAKAAEVAHVAAEEETTEEEVAAEEEKAEEEKAAALAAARKLVDEADGVETVTLDPTAHAAAAAFVEAEQRRTAPVVAFNPWCRLVLETAQDYKTGMSFEAAAFAALYKLVEAKVVLVLSTAGAIAQNAKRLYVGENDVTLALNLTLASGGTLRSQLLAT